MPKVGFRASEGEGWEPLPDATYDIQIDDVEETTSNNENPQIKVSGHVASEGPHTDKKTTDWFVMTDKSGWKLKMLVDACNIDYEATETGETNDKGKPIEDIEFELEDLVGCVYRCDVTTRTWQGRKSNNFANHRSPKASKADKGDDGDKGDEKPAEDKPTAGRRRRRVAS